MCVSLVQEQAATHWVWAALHDEVVAKWKYERGDCSGTAGRRERRSIVARAEEEREWGAATEGAAA